MAVCVLINLQFVDLCKTIVFSFLASSSSTIIPEQDSLNPVFLTFVSLAETCFRRDLSHPLIWPTLFLQVNVMIRRTSKTIDQFHCVTHNPIRGVGKQIKTYYCKFSWSGILFRPSFTNWKRQKECFWIYKRFYLGPSLILDF